MYLCVCVLSRFISHNKRVRYTNKLEDAIASIENPIAGLWKDLVKRKKNELKKLKSANAVPSTGFTTPHLTLTFAQTKEGSQPESLEKSESRDNGRRRASKVIHTDDRDEIKRSCRASKMVDTATYTATDTATHGRDDGRHNRRASKAIASEDSGKMRKRVAEFGPHHPD